jgi:ATP-dependent Clp protease protease subunit
MPTPSPKKAETRSILRAEVNGDKGSLHVYGFIGGWSGLSPKDVSEKVLDLSARGAKSLDVYINSPGGVAFDGIAMYHAIKRFPGKTVVHVDGQASSAASIIAMAGDEIRIPSGAQMMIHAPHGMSIGGAAAMRKLADELDGLRASMIDIYVERTKAKRADIEKWVEDETWMDGKTAVARGFATHVDTDSEQDEDPDEGADEEPEDSVLKQFVATWRNAPPGIAEKYMTQKLAAALAVAPASRPEMIASEPPQAKEANVPTPNDKKQPENKESAEATAAQARADFYEPFIGEIKALTSKDSLTEALGVLTAWKSASESAAALAKENTELKAQYAEGESTRLVEAAVRDGRLTPARREQAMGIGAKSVDGLKAFLEALTPLPVAMQNRERPSNKRPAPSAQAAAEGTPGDLGSGVKLTRKQKLALHGVDQAAFLAHMEKRKAEQAAAVDEDEDE